MKKCVIYIFVIFSLISIFTFKSIAYQKDSLLNGIDTQTKEYLKDVGIDSETLEGAENLSLNRVFHFLAELITDKSKRFTSFALIIISVIILNSIIISFLDKNESAVKTVNFISILCISTVIVIPLKDLIINTSLVIKTSAIFSNTYVPILASLIAASGNIKLALTYNSFSIILSSFITNLADKFFVPVINMLFAFNILSSFTFETYKHKIFMSIKKAIVIILSLVSTIYTGLLTTQSILAVSTDSITVRGIRFISGNFIPIVGTGISESVSSVISSFSLMKNTAGVVVIVVILLLFIPFILDLLVWHFGLQFCSITADLFENKELANLLDELSTIISMINIILLYVTFVLVISTGIIIATGK